MSKSKRVETYAVGQVLYYRAHHTNRVGRLVHNRNQEMTIVEVGRKWLTVRPGLFNATGRVDKETLDADGQDFTSPGRCYRTEQARTEADEVERLWDHLRGQLRQQMKPPGSVDSHALRMVIGRLGLAQPDPQPPQHPQEDIR